MAAKKSKAKDKPVEVVEPVAEDANWGDPTETPPGLLPVDTEVDGWGDPVPPTGKQPPQQTDWTVNETGEPVPNEVAQSNDAAQAEMGGWGVAPETKTVTVELQIKQHQGAFDAEHAKILIYGESGTGKTRLASTFPKVIFADIDQGMGSVTEKVQSIDITDTDGMHAFDKLETMYKFLKAGNHEYETVVIDTLNEMQRVAMHATVEDFPTIHRSYDDLPSQSDYGKMLHDMVELCRDFVALPMRVVLLAQVVSRVFDTDTLQPQLIGKNTSREICRKMDVIGYIYKSEKDNPAYPGKKLSEISFDASQYVTKDRSFKLPAVLPDPTYARISSFWK
jgi:phage nucleotide-binding protein